MFKKYPIVMQSTSKECGVACMQMILKYYHGFVSNIVLNEITKTSANGTNAYDLLEAFKMFGFDAVGVECKLEDLLNQNIILPCIAHVILDSKFQHYVVIYEINKKRKTLLIGDSSKGIYKISFDEFSIIWNKILLIVTPKKTLPKYEESESMKEFCKKILLPHKKSFISILFLSFFLTLFSVLSSFSFQFFLDSIIYKEPKSYFYLLFIGLFGIYCVQAIVIYFRGKLLNYFNYQFDYSLTMASFKQIIHLPYRYYSSKTTGDILSRFQDLETIRNILSKFVFTILIDSFFMVVVFIVLYFMNSTLFIIVLFLFILFFGIFILFRPFFQKTMDVCQRKKAEITSYMVEKISAYETIKGIHLESKVSLDLRNEYLPYLRKISSLESSINKEESLKILFQNIGILILLFIGSFLVMKEKMTIGSVLTFYSLLQLVLEPMKNLLSFDYQYCEAKNALKRMVEIFYEEKDNGTLNSLPLASIELKKLSFSYTNQSILKNVSLTIKSGEKVLLLGSSGSGKSTILKLLMGYYKTSGKMIFINDIPLEEYKKEAFEESILYLSQNENLFTDTLYNNLVLNRKCKQEDVYELIRLCEIEEIISKNSLGSQMLIEEGGFNLSGGQKQRIILARTLLSPFKYLLIDEGMNQMDKNLERRILKRMFDKYFDKTIIMVSHRLENMDLFDKVVLMENGKIKEVREKCQMI